MAVVFEKFVSDKGDELIDSRKAEIRRLPAEKKKEPHSDTPMIVGMLQLHHKVRPSPIDESSA